MKIKEGYILRQVAGSNIVVPVGKLDFDGVITLNDTGVFIWKELTSGCTKDELIKKITAEYDITEEIASKDADLFIQKLRGAKLIDEE